jgi:shikimate dehydrogenase
VADFGLIGYPLSHSFSPDYFRRKFLENKLPHTYTAFPIESLEGLPQLMQRLSGFNVTVPWKQAVISWLDDLDPLAASTGAVNTVLVKDGRSKGYNTDVPALRLWIQERCAQHIPARALILGTGGSALAVKSAISVWGMEAMMVSREEGKGQMSYGQLSAEIFRRFPLVFQCSPAGMFPNTQQKPEIAAEWWTAGQQLFELIYNPEETQLMREARAGGATAENGLKMLHMQAELAWQIWKTGIV